MTFGRLLYLSKRRWSLGVRHGWAEHFIQPRIGKWRIPRGFEFSPVPVHVLTSRHDWRMAMWMLVSLHQTTRLRWPLVLHEDGSLTSEQLELFGALFPGLRVICRKEADESMRTRLEAFPRCAEYRNRMPHGLKSFDIPQLAGTARFLMLDPDVMFFKRPDKILDWAANPDDASCWFNQDFQEPSPITPEQAERELGVKLWPQVNTGLCLITKAAVSNLNEMEEWLGRPELQDSAIQWRVEQTLLALAASKAGIGGLLPSSYEVSPTKHRQAGCVARHYVGCVRDRFVGEGMWVNAQMLKS